MADATLSTPLSPAARHSIERQVAAARAAQGAWGAVSLAARARVLLGWRDRVLARADEIAEALHHELGKPPFEGYAMEVLSLLESITYHATQAERVLAPAPIPLRLARHKRSWRSFAPRGVVALITPWNFPVAIAGSELCAALAAGNAVAWKPSELAPRSSQLLLETLPASELPHGLVQLVEGDAAVGEALVRADVDYVTFVGSTSAGRAVAGECGSRLRPCRVEVGGKGHAIVLEDADVARAAAALVWGAFANAGQVCAGIQRAFVRAEIYAQLCEALRAETQHLLPRNPHRGRGAVAAPPGQRPEPWAPEVAPLCRAEDAARLRQAIEDALARGATLLHGSIPPEGQAHAAPVLLGAVAPDAAIIQQECFAPVLALVPVAHEQEALSHIAAAEHGLMGAVFSRDRGRARQLAAALPCGTVMINDAVWSYGMPETPWSAPAGAGLGVSHGEEGLRGYCELRHINDVRGPLLPREAFWYPYDDRRLQALRLGMRALYGSFRHILGRGSRPGEES